MTAQLFKTWLVLIIPIAIHGIWEIENDKGKMRWKVLAFWLMGCFFFFLILIWQ